MTIKAIKPEDSAMTRPIYRDLQVYLTLLKHLPKPAKNQFFSKLSEIAVKKGRPTRCI